MSIAITGATGNFRTSYGRSAARRGVPAERIIATGRRIETLGDLGDRGVYLTTRGLRRRGFPHARHSPAPTGCSWYRAPKLGSAFNSTPMSSQLREATGVQLIAYTSVVRADTSQLLIAP